MLGGVSETTQPPGRRERKKAATRQALADAALRLFLERGYDQVSVRDVAEAADVSTTTVFKHFPGKEALVFDLEADREAALVAAVRDRPAGQSVPAALHAYVRRVCRVADHPDFAAFQRLIADTPALRAYSRAMWMRHEAALARAVAEDAGAAEDDPSCAALAHFALESLALARDHPDPDAVVGAAFALLERGWRAP
jgi:AcrR family transcriptional regulator